MYLKESFKQIFDQKFNGGPWNQDESMKYLIFLDQNKIVMASRQKKKRFRVFDQMSDFVETRSSLQCRSHHQKAIQKYKQVKQIILHEKQLVDIKLYRLRLKQLRQDAKVKENYENLEKIRIIKEKIPLKQEIKEVKQNSFPLVEVTPIQNYLNSMPAYPYQMIPIAANPLINQCFYYSFFGPN